MVSDMTLIEFLLARIAEDEQKAEEFSDCSFAGVDAWGDGTDLFFGDNAPASVDRVLADCKAKRRIITALMTPSNLLTAEARLVEEVVTQVILENLVGVYADHEDFREEWVGPHEKSASIF